MKNLKRKDTFWRIRKTVGTGRKRRFGNGEACSDKKEVAKSWVYCYTPEMGQQKPDCQMEASEVIMANTGT